MITLADIIKARGILNSIIHKTGLMTDNLLDETTGNRIFLKMENLQRTGSFKVRGAYNRIANLTDAEKEKGVIAASAGNHAQGVALAAKAYGINATIVMPRYAPLSKIKATRQLGANVILEGEVYDDSFEAALKIQQETMATFIHPFDDPLVIAGQGTIGLEILEDLPDVEVVVVPIGGGGLIAGVAAAIKQSSPSIKVVGVQTRNVPSMFESMDQQKIVTVHGSATIADGIAVKTPGQLTFDMVQQYVDEIVTVDEDEISSAILFLLEKVKTVSEGAGAASVAAVFNKLSHYQNKKIAAVVSGGNIDVNILSRIVDQGLVKSGRKVYLDTIIPDKPGHLWKLLQLISGTGVNILTINHKRDKRDVLIGFAQVEVEIETADEEHIYTVKKLLEKNNYCTQLC